MAQHHTQRLWRTSLGSASCLGLRSAYGERGIVVPHGCASYQNGIARGTQHHHRIPIGRGGEFQSLGGAVVNIAIGRARNRGNYIHG
jgi:hypothetical protein